MGGFPLRRESRIQPLSLPLSTGCSHDCPGDEQVGEGSLFHSNQPEWGRTWEDLQARCGSAGHCFCLWPRARSQGQPNHREAANIV